MKPPPYRYTDHAAAAQRYRHAAQKQREETR